MKLPRLAAVVVTISLLFCVGCEVPTHPPNLIDASAKAAGAKAAKALAESSESAYAHQQR
ncbi:hypothetical protein [Lysobacter sp. CA199]|uniref:hypothetical protein n=1 Tax=Lysobacter sp. CA199 TaxID=3455608 RepID=UPI003F8D3904